MRVSDEAIEAGAEAIARVCHPNRAQAPDYWEQWVSTSDKTKFRKEAQAALTAALPHLQAQTLPLVHCARAQGATFEEMRKNLPQELYMRGDTILAWVNEGEIIMHEMALVADKRDGK